MTRTRYTMPAGSRGEPCMRRATARLAEEGVRRRVFAHDADPDVETPVRVRTRPRTAASELCESGCGTAPGTAIDEGLIPLPDCRVLRPGEPTANAVRTAVEDCARFEAFSEGGCATGVARAPAPCVQSERKTEDGRRKER